MDPGHHQSVLRSAGNDPLNVLNDVLFVALQDSATFSWVVTPCGEESGGELVVFVSRYLADEEDLTFGYLVGDRWDIMEAMTYSNVGDALLFYLHAPDTQDPTVVSMKKDLKLVEEILA